MSNTFDLDRFKAGEVADAGFFECYYLADLPDGKIAHKYRDKGDDYWDASSDSLEWFEEYTTMKPKEEWVIIHKTFKGTSFDAAESRRKQYSDPDDFITVKITRP